MVTYEGKDFNYSIEEREQFYNSILKDRPFYSIVIKTCDRTEIYYESYCSENDFNTVAHLFGLTSGIESPLLGETEIFNQVKCAYFKAISENRVSKLLHSLFQRSFYVGKIVRSQTKISYGAISHSYATLKIIKNYFDDFSKLNITIIGVNKLNEDVLKYFNKYGARQIYLGNRTFEKAVSLGRIYNARVFKLDNLRDILCKTDVLISATSAPHTIVREEDLNINRQMLIIDLAVPYDVDQKVRTLKNILYYDVHDLENIVKESLRSREEEKLKAKEIVLYETDKYLRNIYKGKSIES
jgi:glutamyl-tRNA reductase